MFRFRGESGHDILRRECLLRFQIPASDPGLVTQYQRAMADDFWARSSSRLTTMDGASCDKACAFRRNFGTFRTSLM
jgi:hypothetical protein